MNICINMLRLKCLEFLNIFLHEYLEEPQPLVELFSSITKKARIAFEEFPQNNIPHSIRD